jgi:hypothetical protein
LRRVIRKVERMNMQIITRRGCADIYYGDG